MNELLIGEDVINKFVLNPNFRKVWYTKHFPTNSAILVNSQKLIIQSILENISAEKEKYTQHRIEAIIDKLVDKRGNEYEINVFLDTNITPIQVGNSKKPKFKMAAEHINSDKSSGIYFTRQNKTVSAMVQLKNNDIISIDEYLEVQNITVAHIPDFNDFRQHIQQFKL